ncbi:MAG: C39 family peptidase [Candidatus Eremiobacteraeota bacterium]|nr:C39 family peptidase [Candidatus Eremiobacteraeota bacterium]
MANLNSSFAQVLNVSEGASLRFEPARTGVISWNTYAPSGRLTFRLLRAGAPATSWFDFGEWHTSGRKSFSAQSDREGVRVDTDIISADQPFDGIELYAAEVDFNLLAFATPVRTIPSLPYARSALILDVPGYTQYIIEGERGWSSPTSVAMVNSYHGIDIGVEETARSVADRAYNGTGNWSFNVAYSGSLGLRAVVAYLQNLDHAQRLIERNIPVIISYSWSDGELPGAPLEHSDGHLAVLCGFTETGDCAMNDPAAPLVRAVYPRAAIERIWQRNNGVAYVIAPVGVEYLDVLTSPA